MIRLFAAIEQKYQKALFHEAVKNKSLKTFLDVKQTIKRKKRLSQKLIVSQRELKNKIILLIAEQKKITNKYEQLLNNIYVKLSQEEINRIQQNKQYYLQSILKQQDQIFYTTKQFTNPKLPNYKEPWSFIRKNLKITSPKIKVMKNTNSNSNLRRVIKVQFSNKSFKNDKFKSKRNNSLIMLKNNQLQAQRKENNIRIYDKLNYADYNRYEIQKQKLYNISKQMSTYEQKRCQSQRLKKQMQKYGQGVQISQSLRKKCLSSKK